MRAHAVGRRQYVFSTKPGAKLFTLSVCVDRPEAGMNSVLNGKQKNRLTKPQKQYHKK